MLKAVLNAKIRGLLIAGAFLACMTMATGCFGGSFAWAVMPTEGATKVSCAPGQVHVQGYWDYRGGDYVWVMGRCESPKQNCKWVKGRYKVKRRGNVKIKTWKEGHWKCGSGSKVVVKHKRKKNKPVVVVKPKRKPVVVVKPKNKPVVVVKPKRKPVVVVKPKKKPVVVVKPKATPKPKIIVVNPPAAKEKARKAKGKIWIPGHYAWNGKNYKWVPGRFKKVRPGKRWVPGRYKVEVRGNYKVKIWIPGGWR